MATDWLAEWEAYVKRTGKRPTILNPDSREIYDNVSKGAKQGKPGYREFLEAHPITHHDIVVQCADYEDRTGKLPAFYDPDTGEPFDNVLIDGDPDFKFFGDSSVNRVDWLMEWEKYEYRTGKRPSPRDTKSAKIYRNVYQGIIDGRPGYKEFFEAHRLVVSGKIDWLAEWEAYEKRTGKRPSPRDPESSNIYSNVRNGVKTGRPGYKEFFEAHRHESRGKVDWLAEWEAYEKRTGKRPSVADPESMKIYRNVYYGVRDGRPGYKEFFKAHHCVSRGKVDWLAEWEAYVKRTGKRPSVTDPDSRKIYRNVYQGAKKGRPGYKEFFEAHRFQTRRK